MKTMHIYADLPKESPSTSAQGESGFTFKASRGWFLKFKHQSGIDSVVRHGEAVSSNKESVEKYVGEFRHFVNAGGYLSSKCLTVTRQAYFGKTCLTGHTSLRKKNPCQNTNP